MVWKDQVNVLDQARIFKLLARGPRLEGYLTQLRKATKLDFASWGGFAQNFSQRRIPFEHTDTVGTWNAAPQEALFIPTFASTYRGAYLPASALKGALRTGLVFSRWSGATIDRAAASLEGDRPPRRLGETAEASAEASRLRVLAVADSDPVPASTFKIFLSRTASLDLRQADKPQLVWKVAGRGSVSPQRISDATPVFAEMAAPGTEFRGGWEERNFLKNPDFSRSLGWRSTPDMAVIAEAANRYAAAQLALHADYAKVTGLIALQQTIAHLQADLASIQSDSLSCLLCLGWGGGFGSKTAFPDTGLESYRKILKAVPAFSRSVRENIVFPKTRRIIFTGGQPASLAGWVKLELGG
jgi:CRISPR-associated protein Csm5